jgi:hypothetical protein
MNTNDIILSIDAEISRLQQARVLLAQASSPMPAKRKPGRPVATSTSTSNKAISFNPADLKTKTPKRRKISAAGRARIAAAQKARWAKTKATAK